MFKKTVFTLFLLNTALCAGPTHLTKGDEIVPLKGKFRINRSPNVDIMDETVPLRRKAKAYRSRIDFEIGEKSTLQFTIFNHFKLWQQEVDDVSPVLNFKEGFIVKTFLGGQIEKWPAQTLRRIILNSSVEEMFDEESMGRLYEFILAGANKNRYNYQGQLTMDDVKNRFPKNMSLKFFFIPTKYVNMDITDPVKTLDDVKILVEKKKPKFEGVVEHDLFDYVTRDWATGKVYPLIPVSN
jgi:hypothetical protein